MKKSCNFFLLFVATSYFSVLSAVDVLNLAHVPSALTSIKPSCEESAFSRPTTTEGDISAHSEPSSVIFLAEAAVDPERLKSTLRNKEVSFVVLDGRHDYSRGGDREIQKNMSFIRKWYAEAKKTMSENDIHKLVWLPESKVLDDLMNGVSFVPESWLLSMNSYYRSSLKK
jgi:hypothetical protein